MENKKTNYGWVIVALFCLIVFSTQYLQYQMAPVAGRLMERLNITEQQYSTVFNAGTWPAIAFSIILGIITDRFGLKKTVIVCMILAAVGGMWHAFANSYSTMYIAIMLVGFGVTSTNVTCGKCFGTWLSPAAFSIAMGVFMSVPGIAQFLAQSTTAGFESLDTAFLLSGALTVVALVLWIIFGKENKNVAGGSKQELPSIGEAAKAVFTNKYMWLIAIGLMLCLGGQVCSNAFLALALQSKGISEQSAGIASSIVPLGSLFGSLFMPMLATKVGRNKPFLLVFAAVCAVGYAFGWQLEGAAAYAAFFITGLCASAMMPFFFAMPVQIKEIGPKYAGTATGLISTIELLGPTLLPSYVLVPLCTGETGVDFVKFFFGIGIIFVILFVITALLPETGIKAAGKKS